MSSDLIKNLSLKLSSSNEETRKSGYELAKKANKNQLIPLLFEILESQNRSIRKDAAIALISFGNSILIPMIKKFNNTDNEDFIYWTIKIASSLKTKESIAFLLNNFKNSDKNICIFSINEIKKLKIKAHVVELIKCFTHNSWIVRKAASDALYEFKNLAVPALQNTFAKCIKVNIQNEDLTYWTIKTLAKILDKEIVNTLKKYFKNASESMKLYILFAISETNSIEGLDILLNCLNGDIETLRASAAEILIKLGKPVLPNLIDNFKKLKLCPSKKITLEIITTIMGKDSIQFLNSIYKQGNNEIKYYVISSFGKLHGEYVVDILINLIPKSIYTLKQHISNVLSILGDEIIEKLKEYAEHENEEVQFWCINAITKMGWIGLMPLSELMLSENKVTRTFVINALGTVTSKAFIPPLIDALDDELWSNRNSAYLNLLKYNEEALVPIIKIMDINNENQRHWSSKILKNTNNYIEIVKTYVKENFENSEFAIINALCLLTFAFTKESFKLVSELLKELPEKYSIRFIEILSKLNNEEPAIKMLDILSKISDDLTSVKIEKFIQTDIYKYKDEIVSVVRNSNSFTIVNLLETIDKAFLKNDNLSKESIYYILDKFLDSDFEKIIEHVSLKDGKIKDLYSYYYINIIGEFYFDKINKIFEDCDKSSSTFEYVKTLRMKIRQKIISKQHEKQVIHNSQLEQQKSINSIMKDLI